MRICLVSSAYRPYISGVGEHVHYLGSELQKRGHTVHVLTSTCRTIPENKLLPTSRLGTGLTIPFAGGEFTFPAGIKLAIEVKQLFRAQKFDIVHCHGIFPPELAYWAAIYADCPKAVTFHTVTPQLPPFLCNIAAFLLKKLNTKLAAKIAVSQATKRWAEKFFPGGYHVIPNGVDLSNFTPNAPPVLSPAHPRIIYVGRLEKRKGLKYLILALPAVLKEFPKASLVVVGYGPLKSYFMRLAHKIKVSDYIQFVGPVSNSKLPGYYTASTVYVAPTVNPEAMGIVLIEAMACGIPVIASDISGYDEVITNGVNGILVPKRNVAKLAEAIITIISNSNLRNRISENALHYVAQYDWKNIATRIESIYNQIIQ
ncbi:MAG: glycosyltransferase family 4 protein [candidate division WOR-3 bacterium]